MICRYVRHSEVLDYLKLGWDILIPDLGHPHNQWSLMLVWRCQCKIVEPRHE